MTKYCQQTLSFSFAHISYMLQSNTMMLSFNFKDGIKYYLWDAISFALFDVMIHSSIQMLV